MMEKKDKSSSEKALGILNTLLEVSPESYEFQMKKIDVYIYNYKLNLIIYSVYVLQVDMMKQCQC